MGKRESAVSTRIRLMDASWFGGTSVSCVTSPYIVRRNATTLTTTRRISFVGVSNVLSEEKKQQVIALGRLGWSLRRIQRETGLRRETAAGYLKSVGIGVREPGGGGRNPAPDANPAIEVTSDFAADPAHRGRTPASACAPWREWIEARVALGLNAKAIWQELVDEHGFTADYQSVRFRRSFQLTRMERVSGQAVTTVVGV